MLEKFENTALFLWLGQPSTLVLTKTELFKIALKLEEFKDADSEF